MEVGIKSFEKIKMLLDATGGLSLSQVCTVTGLEGSTVQNWVKRGWVAHPIGKRYEEIHIARILIINALKECMKLEHIAKLMIYLNGREMAEQAIRESLLYNYLCESMTKSGQADEGSKGGVESIVESVIKDYVSPDPESRIRLRKALTLMMYACVCTDVKRRTEAMMGQILKELESPKNFDPPQMQAKQPVAAAPAAPVAVSAAAEAKQQPQTTAPRPAVSAAAPPAVSQVKDGAVIPPEPVRPIRITLDEPEETVEQVMETRKTVSQALREWDLSDISSVEKIIIEHDEEARNNVKAQTDDKKQITRPWYMRKPK
ncbi:MAG: DUF1836 domain-containing protein [Oscillospiraceae bacterium]|nr:DUF1836 domain-containing protein [Oscillospiraceae bacterium]